MAKMIAFCGVECDKCPAFIAKKENNDELRRKTAQEWSKQFKVDISPKDVNCDGCTVDGIHIGYCDECEIRRCGLEKKVENCAYCNDYACEKLKKWFENAPQAKANLEISRK